MTGTSSPVPPSPRLSHSSLTPRGRAVVAIGAASALVAGLVVVGSGAAPESAAAAGVASEREVVTLDAASSADLLDRTTLARTGGTRSSLRVTRFVTAPASARPVLRPGYRGPAVASLQRALKVRPTGWYGPMTLASVVAFQRAHGLPSAGYVGARTWAALLTPARPAAAPPAPARHVAAARTSAAPVTAGRVCPAPGAAFGQGWGAPRAGHTHQGMDLVASRGTPLLAIEDGVVIREGRQANGALRIVLQGRSGSKFFYGHMSKDLVHAGSRVRRGQVIGLMGDSGSPGAVHLHFEYWRSGDESAAVDPAPLLRSIC